MSNAHIRRKARRKRERMVRVIAELAISWFAADTRERFRIQLQPEQLRAIATAMQLPEYCFEWMRKPLTEGIDE